MSWRWRVVALLDVVAIIFFALMFCNNFKAVYWILGPPHNVVARRN